MLLKKRLAALVAALTLSSTACTGQILLTAEPFVDAVTYSTARITWSTSTPGTTVIEWGPNPGPPYQNVTKASSPANNTRAHAWFLSGLQAETTYHYRVCSTETGTTEVVCSQDNTFTTTAQGDPGPQPPAEVDVTPPPFSGNVLHVGSDCHHPTTGLIARWQQANWGDKVVIPTTTVCTGNFVFPAKTADTQTPHRWIVTESAAAQTLSLPGTRIAGAPDAGKLARIETNRPNTLQTSTSGLPQACDAGGYAWVSDDPRAFKLQQCRPSQERSILQITGGVGGQPLVITVPGHGVTGSPLVRLDNLLGATPSSVTLQATVLDSNRLRLAYVSWRDWTPSGQYYGGTMTVNKWEPVSFTTGGTLPVTCVAGNWFLRNGVGRAEERSYQCVEENQWKPISLTGPGAPKDASAIDLGTNAAHHLRFVGLEVTSVRLPNEPLWMRLSRDPLRSQPGSVFYGLIYQSRDTHHVVWDRCWIHGEVDRARYWIGLTFDGAHVAVMDSRIDGIYLWAGTEPGTLANEVNSSAFYVTQGPGPFRIENNHIESAGVSLYAPSDWCCALLTEPDDGTVRRNVFRVDEKYRFGAPEFAGRQAIMRHLIELKQGRRWKIEGNIFDGTYTAVNQAAAIALTPRVDRGFFPVASIQSGILTVNPVFGYCPEAVNPGDRIAIVDASNAAHNSAWEVSAVSSNRCSLELAGISGNSTGGAMQLSTNDRMVGDVEIAHNTFQNVANGVFIIGHTDGANQPGVQQQTTRRIRIHNNLFRSIDGSRSTKFDTSAFPNGLGGYPLYMSLGMEDLTFTHNTVDVSSPGPGLALEYEQACVTGRQCNPSSGLIYEHNIVPYGKGSGVGAVAASGTAFGQAALDALWRRGDNPGWVYRKNIIAIDGAALPATPPFGPYPTGNRIHNINTGRLPYAQPSAGDYRLTSLYRSTDNCYGTPGDCTLTGWDVGVNMHELWQAQGNIQMASLRAGSRSAEIAIRTFRPASCTAELTGPSPLTGPVIFDGRYTKIHFEGLEPNQTYEYLARCADGVAGQGTFQTRADGPARRFQLRLRPPAWMQVAEASLWTGTQPGSLSLAQTVNCVSGCRFTVPVADGNRLYYRVIYQRTGQQTIASGPVKLWLP